MPYLVNCLDCSFVRARETTYDMGNGDIVRDQHEFATFDGDGNSHECVIQVRFPPESEFHPSNFDGPITRDPYCGVLGEFSGMEVIVARDEYAYGKVQVRWEYHQGFDSNRYSVLHHGSDLPTGDQLPGPLHFDQDTVTVVRERGECGSVYVCESGAVPDYMLGDDGHEILHTGETPELAP